jgi:3-hydroxybutyryl-CoA dehydrogenase
VAIIGGGIMGIGIAQNFAQAGLAVKLVDVNREILDSAMAQIQTNVNLFQEYRLIQESASEIISRIDPVLIDLLEQVMEDCDYVAEAVPESLEIKKTLFSRLEKCSSRAILASNTSSYTVNELVTGMKNPERVIGVHYFNPAHILPVVEIHWGEKTSKEVVNLARELMLRVGKKPVLVRKTLPGFIVNRLTGALEREIDYLLDEGVVTPEDLDIAVKGSIGFRMACLGPQETEDMIGLDTSMRVSRRVYRTLSNSTEPSPQLVAKVEAGELGIKSGKGWYDYSSRPRTKVVDENNRRLLQQLAVFIAREKGAG